MSQIETEDNFKKVTGGAAFPNVNGKPVFQKGKITAGIEKTPWYCENCQRMTIQTVMGSGKYLCGCGSTNR